MKASKRINRLGPSFLFALAIASALSSRLLAQNLVINEIMQNPSAVPDSAGEWFELFNPSAFAIDIEGWTVEDNDFDSFVISNGGPLLVPAGGFLVLGNNADSGTNGGVTVDYEFSGMAVANGADELVLRDGFLTEQDRVEWDGGPIFPDPNGASMSLASPAVDNNDGANWCEATATFGDGDRGTPGAANDCPAVVPLVVINEIMQNPSAVSDGSGEWFELHNPTPAPINVEGFTVEDNDFDSFVIMSGGPLVIPAGGYLVLGNNADTVTNGGVTVDYEYSGMFLGNSADDVVLRDTLLNEVDRVEYDGGSAFPDPTGASMALIDPALDNNVGGNWCTSPAPFGDGDLGTPGAANDCPVAEPPALVVNEILQNPSAVSDGSGEWFEIFNPTPDPVDVNGWTVADNDFDSFVITGGPLVIAPGGFLVLGNNANSATNGGVTVDFQYSGMFLSNSSDELVLFDSFLNEVDRVEWDNGATFPDPNGASMSLVSPALDNNLGANWCTAPTPFGDGDLGTPGAANDCPLPSIVINEVDADTPGSDSLEFVELFDGGVGSTALDGLVLVFYNGNGDASYRTISLNGFTTDGDGYFLAGNAAVSPAPDFVFPNNGLQNGADAVALYVGDAASFPNGTAVTTDDLIDAVVYDTFDSDDAGLLVLLNAAQPQLNEGGAGNKDNHSNQRCPNGFGGQRNTDSYSQSLSTPGALNNCAPLEIFTIQGSGASSPFDGFVVGTDADVVTALASDGFFMQTPAVRSDGDPDTSDGIFVFTGAAPSVLVGDQVDVVAQVQEFFGMTELGDVRLLSIGSAGNPLPTVVIFDATTPSPVPGPIPDLERFEGMLVKFDGIATGPTNRFGETPVVVGTDRTFREPGIEFPGEPGLPVWDGNPEVFEIDPNGLGGSDADIFAEQAVSAEGPLFFTFGDYQVLPTSLVLGLEPVLPIGVRLRDPGEFTVGSLNLFRLFDDGAEYQTRLTKLAGYIVGVLDAPDILAVQEAEKLGVLQDLATEVALIAPAVVYSAELVEGNDVGGINVGFLVRDTVHVDAVTQLGKNETFVDPSDLSVDILHDRPPLLLEARFPAANVVDDSDVFKLSVLGVHNRSLNGIDGSDGERVRAKRLAQAQSIAQMIDDRQGKNGNKRVMVIGDFNAFEFTDGYVDVIGQIKGAFDPLDNLVSGPDLTEPNLANVVDTVVPVLERYSFIFGGNAQTLDHALLSEKIEKFLRGAEFGRGNADAPASLIEDDSTVLRASDHDGLVIYIQSDPDEFEDDD